ncbi:hypothetical protein [Oryzibacter oryziterrae]|uniref:hypothetical protein n=1 Tax=Oryzibacter oryziterrae TaxID=2766474 RepID=UPI001F3E147F|nr:hypothetical protein [Oryzibacter oryziterrae]
MTATVKKARRALVLRCMQKVPDPSPRCHRGHASIATSGDIPDIGDECESATKCGKNQATTKQRHTQKVRKGKID